jgi:ADP-ribose pyrophosphatase YjhB (NUDIX family)
MTLVRDTFCNYCGAAYPQPLRYPRSCASCNTQVWANPIPVAVPLIPVVQGGRVGLLVVRRGIEPQKGKLALAGGFIEEHETWAEGAAREVREEAAVSIDPARLKPFWYTSTAPRPNRVLLFSVAEELDASALPPCPPNAESSERGLIFGPDGLEGVFAFPLHIEAARRFFAERGITGDHGYVVV